MKSKKLLDSLVAYCTEHPKLRFWQALRAWVGWGFIFVCNDYDEDKNEPIGAYDTFYWEDNKKPE